MKDKRTREEEMKLILDETERQLREEQQKENEKLQLFIETDALTPAELRERNLKRETEIIHLVGGGITSIAGVKSLISQIKLPYEPMFGHGNALRKHLQNDGMAYG